MKKGRRFRMHGLNCVYIKTSLDCSRIGFAVSRKYGNAVQRHYFKRCWREVFRCHPVKALGLDVLIIPAAGQCKHIHEYAMEMLNELMDKQMCLKS